MRPSENPQPEYAGEIIESSLSSFIAQCPSSRLYEPPLFGSFVRTPPPSGKPTPPLKDSDPFAESSAAPEILWEEGVVYAVVCMANTQSLDPSRRPSAYGLTEERLRAEQPQIFDLLATEFASLSLGYVRQGKLRHTLPPRPPRIHAFVGECNAAEVRALTQSPEFLRPLLQHRGAVNPDDLVVAALHQASEAQADPYAYLVAACRRLAHYLREEPQRLTSILKQLEA